MTHVNRPGGASRGLRHGPRLNQTAGRRSLNIMDTTPQIVDSLRNGLVVSCQPVPSGPFDRPDLVVAFARAAESSGAVGLRIEGVDNIRAVAAATRLPIIGLIKRDLPDSPVRITPLLEDARAVAEAGAAIIAFDATARPRPVPVPELVRAIRGFGRIALADVANVAEGQAAHDAGSDLIGSTLSGYTGDEPPPDVPDLALVRALAGRGFVIIAEGNVRTPEHAAAAIRAGAFAVVVGSAITRPEYVTEWFAKSIERAVAGF